MIKVLYFIDSLRAGGKERQLVSLIRGLKETGKIYPIIISLGGDKFLEEPIKTSQIPIIYIERKFRWDIMIFIKIFRAFKQFNPSIIQTHCWMTSFFALPIVRIKKIIIINNSIRNAFSGGGLRWIIERLLLILSDIRLANSYAGLSSRRLNIKSNKNRVIYNGYDFNRLGKESEIGYSGSYINKQKKIVGMVAEFKNHKDYDTYFKAAEIILRKRNDVAFYAIGGGANYSYFRNKYNNYSDKIIFTGRQKNVDKFIKRFDIGVLATFTEGISNAILEYMVLSKPVIATAGGGTNELVQDGITGILIPPKDPVVLANKIEHLLSNPLKSKKMGENGKERIKKKFGLERLVQETLKLYEDVITD